MSVCLSVRVCVRNQVANWARRSPLIKKPILGKLFGAANNLWLDPFPDPVGHFGDLWRPFWILQAVPCFSEKDPSNQKKHLTKVVRGGQ